MNTRSPLLGLRLLTATSLGVRMRPFLGIAAFRILLCNFGGELEFLVQCLFCHV
jgi:hypothetical protein